MKFSSETRDKEGDLFLKSAWEHKEDKNHFAKKGYYDYNHLSQILKAKPTSSPEEISKSELSRVKAIIGRPDPDPTKAIFWSDVENGALTEGFLNKDNQYVKEVVSLLKSGYDRFQASAAGGAYPPNQNTTKQFGEKTWDRATLQHIAICPTSDAINEDTYIKLKSALVKDLEVPEIKIEIGSNPDAAEHDETFEDVIHQYILESYGYASWVAEKLMRKVLMGLLPVNYESIKSELLKFKVPEKSACESAEDIILMAKGERRIY